MLKAPDSYDCLFYDHPPSASSPSVAWAENSHTPFLDGIHRALRIPLVYVLY
jgi:hypothetical protein